MSQAPDQSALVLRQRTANTLYRVENRRFESMADLLKHLSELKETMDQNEFRETLTDVAVGFTDATDELDHDIMLLYDFAQKNIQHFGAFRKSSEFKHYWTPIEKKHAEAERNERSAHKAAELIKQVWGDAGNALLQIRGANQFVRRLGQAAAQLPTYEDFTKVFNRVRFDRLSDKHRRGRAVDSTPGTTDVVRTLNLLKITKNGKPVAAGPEELPELLGKIAAVTSEEAEPHGLVLDPYGLLVEAVGGPGQIIGTLSEVGGSPWANRNQDFTHPSSIGRESPLDHAIAKDNPVDTPEEGPVPDINPINTSGEGSVPDSNPAIETY